jgi:TolB protein
MRATALAGGWWMLGGSVVGASSHSGWLKYCGVALSIALLASVPVTATAQAEGSAGSAGPGPAIVVTPGETRAFHAAVQIFDDASRPPNAGRAVALRAEISEGMAYSSVLLPLPDAAFLGDLLTKNLGDGPRADCGDWTQSGADALVEGRITGDPSALEVEWQVWDSARCVRLAKGKFTRRQSEMRRMGRLLADAVVKAFTGTPGVAGTEVAFISDRSGAREVYVMDSDGARQRAATRGDSIKAFPNWMPDGGAILYTSYQNGVLPGLFLTSRGQYKPGLILSRTLADLPKYRGVLAPDGAHLAMVTSLDGAAEIFRVNRLGKELHRLTRNGGIDISPSWSPDGERIVFVSDRSGAPQLYLMNRDGGELRRLSFNGSYNTSPSWSPDGRWIAYETRVGGQFDIWLIDPSGEVNLPLIAHYRSDEHPSWSPDSRKLAFSSTRRGQPDIYVIDLNGENLRRLTSKQGENLQPSWGPFTQN